MTAAGGLPVATFAVAAEAFVALVDGTGPDRWDGPGLGGWDLRALVGHASRSLVTVETYLDRPAPAAVVDSAVDYYRVIAAGTNAGTGPGADAAAVLERGRQAGVALRDDPAGAVAALRSRVVDRVDALAAAGEDPVIESIVGGIRLSDYLPTRTFELVVHGLDIAAALAVPPPAYGAEVLTEVLALATGVAVAGGDGPALLLALTGRTALPPGYSMV